MLYKCRLPAAVRILTSEKTSWLFPMWGVVGTKESVPAEWLTKASFLLCVCLSVKTSLFSLCFFKLCCAQVSVIPCSWHDLQLIVCEEQKKARSKKARKEIVGKYLEHLFVKICFFHGSTWLKLRFICVQGYCYIPIAIYVCLCWTCIYQNTVNVFLI